MAHTQKVGRNDPCPCGSGKKFKRCCETSKQADRRGRVLMVVVAAIIAGAIAVAFSSLSHDSAAAAAPGSVWSPEHGHYHPR